MNRWPVFWLGIAPPFHMKFGNLFLLLNLGNFTLDYFAYIFGALPIFAWNLAIFK